MTHKHDALGQLTVYRPSMPQHRARHDRPSRAVSPLRELVTVAIAAAVCLVPTALPAAPVRAQSQGSQGYCYHRVQPGETPNSIALRYGIAPVQLVLANNMGGYFPIPGTGLVIPNCAVDSGEKASVHTVTPGENLAQISERHSTSPWEIAMANPPILANPDSIRFGQRLIIPDGGRGTPGADVISGLPTALPPTTVLTFCNDADRSGTCGDPVTEVRLPSIDYAILKDGAVVHTGVTDQNGRGKVQLAPGTYSLRVQDPSWTNPYAAKPAPVRLNYITVDRDGRLVPSGSDIELVLGGASLDICLTKDRFVYPFSQEDARLKCYNPHGGPNDFKAVDVRCIEEGTSALAIDDGTVVGVVKRGENRYVVLVDNPLGRNVAYAHLREALVSAGQRLLVGQVVGAVGGNPRYDPNSTTVHLEIQCYEGVWGQGRFLDLLDYTAAVAGFGYAVRR